MDAILDELMAERSVVPLSGQWGPAPQPFQYRVISLSGAPAGGADLSQAEVAAPRLSPGALARANQRAAQQAEQAAAAGPEGVAVAAAEQAGVGTSSAAAAHAAQPARAAAEQAGFDIGSAAGAASAALPAIKTAADTAASTPTAPATATDAATQPTPQPQFADDDPNSPYHTLDWMGKHQLIETLDNQLMRHLKTMHWSGDILVLPGAPTTAAAAAQLQAQVDQLLSEGQLYDALAWQYQIAMYSFHVLGPEHADTVRAVWALVDRNYQCGHYDVCFYLWLLPRAARQWGLGHPDTRKLLNFAAEWVYDCSDLRTLAATELTRAVTSIARHIPGGLGWGIAKVTDIDADAYNRQAVLQGRGENCVSAGEVALGKAMTERCLAYWESLAPHWLASPRKVQAKVTLARCHAALGEKDLAAAVLLEAKRTAQRELGPGHRTTLMATWQV